MGKNLITQKAVQEYIQHLREAEYAQGSIAKYLRDLRAFWAWTGERPVERRHVLDWKGHLQTAGYRPGTVNSMLASLNSFFRFMGWDGCRMKYLKIQRKLFRSAEQELTKEEYLRLIETAEREKRNRLALLMESICAMGIRVSEVKYLTVEAVQAGRADISLKGKIRTVLIPGKLQRKLCRYVQKQKITAGEIFRTRTGRGLSRRQIWAEMKALCRGAGVAATKVFPHNLRHLFARTFYRTCRDVAKLADVLGHSSMETTRIYLAATGAEHVRQMERLGLVS